MIDDDAQRYAVDLLRNWRDLAESLATAEQGRAITDAGEPRELAVHDVLLGEPDQIGRGIDDFLTDIGAPRAFGDDERAVFMLLKEIALNTVTHGKATVIRLGSMPGVIQLRDNGAAFGKSDLLKDGRGGNRALRDLEEFHAGTFVVTSQRVADENVWSIIDEVIAEGADVPCRVVLHATGFESGRRALSDLRELADCSEIHFYASRYISYSDIYIIADAVREELRGRRLWVHGIPPTSPLRTVILGVLPTANVAG